jgi:hypothetical protein
MSKRLCASLNILDSLDILLWLTHPPQKPPLEKFQIRSPSREFVVIQAPQRVFVHHRVQWTRVSSHTLSLLDSAVLGDVASEQPRQSIVETGELLEDLVPLARVVSAVRTLSAGADLCNDRAFLQLRGEHPALEVGRVLDLQRVAEVAESDGVYRA